MAGPMGMTQDGILHIFSGPSLQLLYIRPASTFTARRQPLTTASLGVFAVTTEVEISSRVLPTSLQNTAWPT